MCIRDRFEGARWYKKAAEKGSAEAMLSLGYCYHGGDGVPRIAEKERCV